MPKYTAPLLSNSFISAQQSVFASFSTVVRFRAHMLWSDLTAFINAFVTPVGSSKKPSPNGAEYGTGCAQTVVC